MQPISMAGDTVCGTRAREMLYALHRLRSPCRFGEGEEAGGDLGGGLGAGD